MKHQLDITKGEWKITNNDPNGLLDASDAISIESENEYDSWNVAAVWKDISNYDDNAKLICDAGNTYQSCGELPSELLRQRDELKSLASKLIDFFDNRDGINTFPGIYFELKETLKNCE